MRFLYVWYLKNLSEISLLNVIIRFIINIFYYYYNYNFNIYYIENDIFKIFI